MLTKTLTAPTFIQQQDLAKRLTILTDAAKYDVACTSSGVDRENNHSGGIGNSLACGICHSFASDGRCISLLKILQTNDCIFDCKYCINRASNDVPRASFTPREVADLTIQFYRRNYIEGLFLSSAVLKNPTFTMQLIYESIRILREEYLFQGYIHVKAIPGADPELIAKTGLLADRMSCNIELPSESSLRLLAPNKTKKAVLAPMAQIATGITQNKQELMLYRRTPKFVPAGQSTQMIIGATPDTDHQILQLTEKLYEKYSLKRVFYSAFLRVNDDSNLPVLRDGPPLLREHRLYQADWLLRFYEFKASEILDENNPNFNALLDPKCNWAINHMEQFPVEVNKADYHTLLRVPGIGVTSAKRIVMARRSATLDFPALKRLGVVLKRAQFFITCQGKQMQQFPWRQNFILGNLIAQSGNLPKEVCAPEEIQPKQLSLFDLSDNSTAPALAATPLPSREDRFASLTGAL